MTMKKIIYNQKQKNSFILIISLFLLGILSALIFYAVSSKGSIVVIEIAGAALTEIPLSKDIIYPIYTEEDGENILEIKDGKAYVKSANCSNQVCVHSRAISQEGESIICLPHKVNIFIK